MPPMPVNATGRVWIDYVTGGGVTSQEHTVMARYDSFGSGNFAGALTWLALLINEIGASAFYDGWQAVGARYSNPEGVTSIPAPLPASLTSFVGSGQAAATLASQARETRFVGRSPIGGRRVSFSLYGIRDIEFAAQDFRITSAGDNFVGRVLDVIEEAGDDYFVAIDGAPALWQPYANWQSNSYWERELRT